MSVLGFDIGNETCVIGAVKQRGIDVLLNDESKRETPTVVSFGEKQRFLGSAGAACATMNPKSTISQVKRLIGRNFDHPDVQNDLEMLPFETSKAGDGGILIHLQYLGERQTFTPVQILAMIFSHLKQTAEKNLELPVSDCVMGIPCYFTDLQRRLYIDAANVAGLRPLRLMHDCTATALGYGIYKTDNHNSDQSCVVFIDVGHSDTQVAVVSFKSGHMRVLSHAFDCNLGARDFDEVLFRYFAVHFKEQYGISVYSSDRACIRLRAACDKLKKVLSANLEAPLHIECLIDDKDVKGFIKRDEFENLSSDLLDRLIVPCQKALIDSGVTLDRIQSVELVGSGSRIPSVGKTLASFFKQEPRRTLNASECVARGCALQCAMLGPTFRVKDYEVEDSLPFSIGFTVIDDGPIQSQNGALFPKGHSIPSDKIFTLHKSSAFQMAAYYADENELPSGVSSQISIFTISLPSQIESVKVKVKACLTLDGTATLVSASAVGVSMDEVADRSSIEMSAESREGEAGYGSSDAGYGLDDRYSYHSKQTPGSYRQEKGVKAMSRMEIPIGKMFIGGMNEAELMNAQVKEAELTRQDNQVEQAKEKKNSLESYVYEMRNKILSAYQAFATDSEKEVISETLQQTEDWLYEDGEDQSATVYADKLQELTKLVDPIERRHKDEEDRVRTSGAVLDNVRKWKRELQSLPASKKDGVLAECGRFEHWLHEKTQQQESWPKNKDPVVWSSDIQIEADALKGRLHHIIDSEGSYSDESRKEDDMLVD